MNVKMLFVLVLLVWAAPPLSAQGLMDERLVVRKDREGAVLPSDQASLQRLRARLQATGPERLIVQIKPHPDYRPAAIAVDPEVEAQVRAQHEATMERVQESLGRHRLTSPDLEPRWALPFPLMVVLADASRLDRLASDPDVQVISENLAMGAQLADTQALIGTATMHAAGATGSGKSVAVLDTGVQLNHPMFVGKIPTGGEICWASSNPGHSGCPAGITRGVAAAGAGETCTHPNPVGCDHGTHVAGIAIGGAQAVPPNGPTIVGTAVQANLLPVRVASLTADNTDCAVIGHAAPCVMYWLDDTVAALAWVYNNRLTFGVAAVNISYGTLPAAWSPVECRIKDFEDLAQLADALTSGGVAVVASSGNAGTSVGWIAVPACLENVIAVASVDKQGGFATYSSVNQLIDLLAPGGTPVSGVISALPGSSYGPQHGTSMAAPHVAGAIAAMKSQWPNASVGELKAHLINTGVSTQIWYGSNPHVQYLFKPRIDLAAAVAVPTSASYLSVSPMACYGQNWVMWTPASGTVSHHQIEGSYASTFTWPFSLYSGPDLAHLIDVSGTTWIRVRGCNGPVCGAWTAAGNPATYVASCF